MNKPENIIIHHTAVSREKNNAQLEAVNNYHKKLGFPKSDLGYYCGYQYFIEPDGKRIQARENNDVGAHCSQQSMNYKSIGICLTGNFDEEEPTNKQIESLQKLIVRLMKKHGIPESNIYGHRYFASYKNCPGNNFTDEMINNILNYTPMISTEVQEILQTNFAPMTEEELEAKAKEWNALEEYQEGCNVITPKNLHDLRIAIIEGRMRLKQ